jgi:hypothetical protein
MAGAAIVVAVLIVFVDAVAVTVMVEILLDAQLSLERTKHTTRRNS